MLTNILKKVKAVATAHPRAIFVAALVVLIGIISFGVGRLTSLSHGKEPITIRTPTPSPLAPPPGIVESATANHAPTPAAPPVKPTPPPATTGSFVASRNGHVYHYPWCPGAKQIKDANKIWFLTRADAEKAGYKPAANCPGL